MPGKRKACEALTEPCEGQEESNQGGDIAQVPPRKECNSKATRSRSGRKSKRLQGTKHVTVKHLEKKMVIPCEWNLCRAEFNKMELFLSHTREHLASVSDCVTNDGHVCLWRECDFSCDTKEELDRHVLFHAFHTKIKSCGEVLLVERKAECVFESTERNMIPEIPDPFECLWKDCNIKFASAYDFYCHALGHVLSKEKETTEEKPFKCAWDECSKGFSNYLLLKYHVQQHTQQKIIGCPNCGGIFGSFYTFYDHYMRQAPVTDNKYKCTICPRRYPSKRLLMLHIKNHRARYKCSVCGLVTDTMPHLKTHIRHRHRDERPFKCTKCKKCFAFKDDLFNHRSVHTNEPLYPCLYDECELRFFTRETRNIHAKRVHEEIDPHHYLCHLCPLRYTVGRSLTRHLTTKHNLTRLPGHTRFCYRQNEEGFYSLVTTGTKVIKYKATTPGNIKGGRQKIREEEMEEEDEETVDSPDAPPSPLIHVEQ